MLSCSSDHDRDIRYYFDTASFLVSSAEAADRELAERTGKNFNVFDVFGVNYEPLLSRILRELLDPDGSHGQGARFLQAFLDLCAKQCGKPLAEAEDLPKAKVIAEWRTKRGRRIDIVIRLANNRSIGIENKPWASEGKDQLRDYAEELKNRSNDFFLVYLCGHGEKPSTLGDYEWLRKESRFIDMRFNRGSDGVSLKLWAQRCAEVAEADKIRMIMRDFCTWLGKFDEFTEGADANA